MTSTVQLSPQDINSYSKCAQFYAILNTEMYADSAFKKAARVLRKKGDINFQIPSSPLIETNGIGSSLLHIARMTDNFRITDDLLSLGADFTSKSKDGDTALLSVFKNYRCDSFINLILSTHIKFSNYCNPCDNNGFSHFHVACITNHIKAVEFFLENGVDVNETVDREAKQYQGFTPLHFAVKFFNKETVEVLLKYGADVSIKNDCQMTPLHQLLIKKIDLLGSKIRLTEDEETKKISQNRVQIIDSIITLMLNNLLDEEQILDDAGLSSFHIACTMQDTAKVKNLLEQIKDLDHHISMDSQLWPGYTALHFAAVCVNIESMELLYRRGANIDAKNAEGLSPFDICLKIGFIEDVHSVVTLKPQWANIHFSDNKTKLVNLLSAMQNTSRLRDYLHDCVDNINMALPYHSPLWPGCTPLHLAVILSKKYPTLTNNFLLLIAELSEVEGDSTLERVELLLNRGADVTCKDASGRTPLHHAFLNNKAEIGKLLRTHHHSFANPMDKDNLSHLHIAYAENDGNLVEKLLSSNKADANVPYTGQAIGQRIKPGWIPLDCARYCYEKINQFLMIQHNFRDFPSDVRIGINSLHSVCEKGDKHAMEWILNFGANINSTLDDGQTPLHIAVKRDSVEVVEVLLQRGADLIAKDGEGHTPLSHVYEKSCLSAKDLTTSTYRRLMVTILTRNEELQSKMEKQTGITLLHIACCMLDIDQVSTQLCRGSDVNARVHEDSKLWPGCTPLLVLMKRMKGLLYDEKDSSDKIAIIKLLLKNGADVHVADTDNRTPVHLSCYRIIEECSQFTELLFKHHRDFRINSVDCFGLSHFHIAIMLNDVEAVEQFLKHGVDVNQLPDYFDGDEQACLCENDAACWCVCTSPLYIAVDAVKKKSLSDTQMIDLLLSHGADVNLEDVRGRTALHGVLHTGPLRLHLTKKLLSFGADLHHESIDGRTLFEKLLRSDDFEEIDFFLQHGCLANVFNPISDEGLLGIVLQKENKAVRDFLLEKLMEAPDAMKVNELGRTVIHNVVAINEPAITRKKYLCLFQKFKETGHDVDAQDREGRTALHLAAQFGNDTAISALLDMGADLNIIDSKGKSALSYANEICVRCDDEYLNDDHYHEDAITALVLHLFKLHYFDLEYSQLNRDLITESLKILGHTEIDLEKIKFRKKFHQECNKAKNFIVRPLTLTLDSFLSETKAVINYSRMSELAHDVIDSVLETINKNDFSQILSILKLQYRKAMTRFQLSEAVSISLNFLARLRLPDLCADNILRFLSVGDLKNLIAAANLTA